MPDRRKPPASWPGTWRGANGYAPVFAYETAAQKRIVEIETAREWCRAMREDYGARIGSDPKEGADPPDCLVETEGKPLGVELVQLITSDHKRRSTRAESPYSGALFGDMQWTRHRFSEAMRGLIEKKSAIYRTRTILIDVLLIHSDEPWLSHEQVQHWLADAMFRAPSAIKAAYFMMAYAPGRGRDTWPLFPLFGHAELIRRLLPNPSRARAPGG